MGYGQSAYRNEFERKREELRRFSRSLSERHLQFLRSSLFFDTENLISELEHEIHINCMSYRGGVDVLQFELKHLAEQDFLIMSGQAQLYLIVEKERKYKNQQIALKQIGFVSGGAQFFAGAGVCVGSLGAACAGYGAPMAIQGANNAYESGYYLLLRKDISGPVRDAYRYTAQTLGYSNDTADIVYGAVDLGLTGYGAARQVLLPRHKSWKLFHQIKSDYIYGWQEMSKVAIATDAMGSVVTSYSIYRISGNER